MTDAVFLLGFRFLSGVRPECPAACDTNGDGQVTGNVTDLDFLLTFDFLGWPPPTSRVPSCGPLGAPGKALGCEAPGAGCGDA